MKVNYFWKKHGMGQGTKNLEQKGTYNTYLKKKKKRRDLCKCFTFAKKEKSV